MVGINRIGDFQNGKRPIHVVNEGNIPRILITEHKLRMERSRFRAHIHGRRDRDNS